MTRRPVTAEDIPQRVVAAGCRAIGVSSKVRATVPHIIAAALNQYAEEGDLLVRDDAATVERAAMAAFNDRYPDRSWDSATLAEQLTWRGNIEVAIVAVLGGEAA